MESEPPSRSAASYNRRRAGKACFVCRARKTKCDNIRPVCGFCAATDGECRYADSEAFQFDRASLAILQRLETLEETLIGHIGQSWSQQVALSAIENSRDCALSRADLEIRFGSSKDVAQFAEDMPPSSATILQAKKVSIEASLRWPIFAESAPHLKEDLNQPVMHDLGVVREPHPGTSMGSSMLDLDAEAVPVLVENFLSHNHIKNPILNIGALRKAAKRFVEVGPLWDGQSCLVLLVCAVSHLSCSLDNELAPGPSRQPKRLASAQVYFDAAQRRIGLLYQENSLVAAQCFFLTAVYLMSTMQILAAWKCLVQAGTQSLALLACQNSVEEQMIHEGGIDGIDGNRHAEESLYWSCLKSELELRFELGLPGSGLNDVKYQHPYPSPPRVPQMLNRNRLEMDWDTPTSQHELSDQQNLELGWFFYLAEVALKRIMHRVQRGSFGKAPPHYADMDGNNKEAVLAGFQRQLDEWYALLPTTMTFPISPDEPTGDILRFILKCHMIDVKELFHLLPAQTFFAAASPLPSQDIGPWQIQHIGKLLEVAVARIKVNREAWYHRHQGTWLMIRSCSRSALQLLAVALSCQKASSMYESGSPLSAAEFVEEDMLPDDWEAAVREVIRLLDYWSDDSLDIGRLHKIISGLLSCYYSTKQDAGGASGVSGVSGDFN